MQRCYRERRWLLGAGDEFGVYSLVTWKVIESLFWRPQLVFHFIFYCFCGSTTFSLSDRERRVLQTDHTRINISAHRATDSLFRFHQHFTAILRTIDPFSIFASFQSCSFAMDQPENGPTGTWQEEETYREHGPARIGHQAALGTAVGVAQFPSFPARRTPQQPNADRYLHTHSAVNGREELAAVRWFLAVMVAFCRYLHNETQNMFHGPTLANPPPRTTGKFCLA